MARALPPSASVALPEGGAKLSAPAALRNTPALVDLLGIYAPTQGKALEIASGTGQHVTAFATALPGVQWQPTDVELARCASTDAHVAEAGLSNVAPAQILDATQLGWAEEHPDNDLILMINLTHLITTPEVTALIEEAAKALSPEGSFIIYGPFKRADMLTSDGDIRFDAELRGADPQIGYKDTLDITDWLSDAGLIEIKTIEMPANNLAFIARKPSP